MAGGQGGKKQVSRKKRPATANDEQPAKRAAQRPAKPAAAPASKGDPQLALAKIVAVEDDYSGDEAPSQRKMAVDKKTGAKIAKQLRSKGGGGALAAAGTDVGVLYIGHIPHGFYEEQMRGFFSQFGAVTRLRLARNKRTGKSKHYAFVEFEHREVAQIVAKAMDGYMMYSKLLVCKALPPEQVHPETFKGANKPFRKVDWAKRERVRHNAPKDAAAEAARLKGLVGAERKKRRKLAEMGIEYEFGGYEAARDQRKAKRARRAAAAAPAKKANKK